MTYAVLFAALMFAQNILSFGIDRTVYRFVPDLTLRGERGQLLALYLGIGAARVAGITLSSSVSNTASSNGSRLKGLHQQSCCIHRLVHCDKYVQ